MAQAALSANYIMLIPTLPSSVPANAFFADSSNGGAHSIKSQSGEVVPVTGSSSENLLIKRIKISAPVAQYRPVALLADGTVVEADSDAIGAKKYIGSALEPGFNAGDFISVLLVGPNMTGALVGAGFTSGDEIFISHNGGFTNDTNSFNSQDDIIRAGFAHCASGLSDSVATDLIMFGEIITRI
jgi:hypothetical protein